MPIRRDLRYLYPIDWPQISHWVRFVRAKGRCEACGRPHGEIVRHLGDGRWWDEAGQTWRDGQGRKVPSPALLEDTPVLTTKVVLAAAHLDHNPGHCGRRHSFYKPPDSNRLHFAASVSALRRSAVARCRRRDTRAHLARQQRRFHRLAHRR